MPFFIEIMNAVSRKNLGMENTEHDVRVKFCFLYSVLMNERWHELSLLKRVNTILIIEGGCTKKVCTVLCICTGSSGGLALRYPVLKEVTIFETFCKHPE